MSDKVVLYNRKREGCLTLVYVFSELDKALEYIKKYDANIGELVEVELTPENIDDHWIKAYFWKYYDTLDLIYLVEDEVDSALTYMEKLKNAN